MRVQKLPPEYSKQDDRFLNNLEDEDLTEEDLHFIKLAEKEYADGETISHDKRVWK